jgi:hypothetical protein
MKTLVSLMKRTIAQKHTLLQMKIKLIITVRLKVRLASHPNTLKRFSLVFHSEASEEDFSCQWCG